jgi:hypothetical protein
MEIKRALFISCGLIASAGAALAQAPPGPVALPAQTVPPSRAANCAPMQPMPNAGTAVPDGTTTGQGAEALGDKLARSDGVLCPPAGIDPGIRTPTPDAGRTPVIPPPGSPDGDLTVRPK